MNFYQIFLIHVLLADQCCNREVPRVKVSWVDVIFRENKFRWK